MKNPNLLLNVRNMATLATFAFAISAASAGVTIAPPFTGTFSELSNTSELAFSGQQSGSDLLSSVTPVAGGTGWNTGNGATLAELTDGIHGGSFTTEGSTVSGAWTKVGATAEYVLGTGTNGTGYDITSIQSIAAWLSASFGNQAWKVEVKPVGGNYITLATVDYQPISGAGSSKVTLSNLNVTGIVAIKITANQVNGGDNLGAFVWREVDVFGAASGPDETPPQLVSLNPANGATGVLPAASLVATFNEAISKGSGFVTIRNLDNSSEVVIPIADAQVTVSGRNLTINPHASLAGNSRYEVLMGAASIRDAWGNGFAGFGSATPWTFTTGEVDSTPPAITALSPADNSAGVSTTDPLVATFGEAIALGSGTITLRNLTTPAETVTITLPDSRVSVSGSTLTIIPQPKLKSSTGYAVLIGAGAVTDPSGNAFPGISSETAWNFTTASEPLRIMCIGDSITAGYTDNPTWNHPFKFGYRSGLYTRLTNAGYNFTFVGASPQPWNNFSGDPSKGGTYTPALDLRNFGQDGHRGYGGASIGATSSNVAGYIAVDKPDVILLMIGINGIGTGSPAALNTLVNNIVTNAPNAHLIVAQITPQASFNQDLYNYNVYIRDTLVPTYASIGKKISTVDLYSLFLVNPANYSSAIKAGVLSNNINHPNNTYYDLMAQEWFKAIGTLGLEPVDNFTSWISNPAYAVPTDKRGIDDDPDLDGVPNGVEAWFGTNPSSPSSGIASLVPGDAASTFTHPRNTDPPAGLTASYEWSSDLQTWYLSGNGPGDGTTAAFSAAASGGSTQVTVTPSEPMAKLFVRLRVDAEAN